MPCERGDGRAGRGNVEVVVTDEEEELGVDDELGGEGVDGAEPEGDADEEVGGDEVVAVAEDDRTTDDELVLEEAERFR